MLNIKNLKKYINQFQVSINNVVWRYCQYLFLSYLHQEPNSERIVFKGLSFSKFYNLKKESSRGFIKIKYLTLTLLIVLIGLGMYLAVLWQFEDKGIEQICTENKVRSIEDINNSIKETPDGLYGFYHYVYINPKTSEVERIFFDQDGKFSNLKRLTDDGYHKSNLKLFSLDDSFRFGYFQDLHKSDENFDENDDKQREEYYKNYTSLMINSGYGSTPVEVYRGNYHTSSWEWEGVNHVKVYNSCGTCCQYFYLINIETQKIEEEGHLIAEERACMQTY